MRYCTYCGKQVLDEAVICVNCGCKVQEKNESPTAETHNYDTMQLVVKIFLILGCVAQGFLLIPLAWCIPMTMSVLNSFKNNQPVSTSMKVCTLLFVNLIAGICLLCMDDAA